MNKEQLAEILKKHELWMRGKGGCKADLRGADLIWSDMHGANLSCADLNGANLSEANLIGANLSGANLNGSRMNRSNLSEANLIGAIMNGADLSRANMIGANLRHANLSGADLSGARLFGANLDMTVGIRHAHCGWHAHGKYGGQLLAVEIAGEIQVSCEYFEGTAEELEQYIEAGTEKHKASMRKAMAFVLSCFDNHQMYKDGANEP